MNDEQLYASYHVGSQTYHFVGHRDAGEIVWQRFDFKPYHLPSPSEIDPEAKTRIRAYGLSLGFGEAELDAVTEGKLPTK